MAIRYDPNTGQPYDDGTGGGYTTQPMPRYIDPSYYQMTGQSPTPWWGSEGNDTANAGWQATPDSILQMSNQIARQTGAGYSSQENLNDWLAKAQENGWTQQQLYSAMTQKALEPDSSAANSFYGSGQGMFGAPLFQASSPFDAYSPVNVGQFSYNPLNSPQNFQLPTGQQALDQDPGYQFRLQQGLDALQNSAAARGGLGDPNTLRAIEDYGQGAASQEYQNAYNRALQTYQTNTGTNLQAQQQQYQQGLGAFQTNAQTALAQNQQNFGNALSQYQTNFSDPLAAYQANTNAALGFGNLGLQSQLGLGNLGINQGYLGLATDQQGYNQLYNLAGLGLNAAGGNASTGLGYVNGLTNLYGNNANAMGNYITGAGNANAAGQVGSANAWNGALGNLGNLGSQLGLLSALQNKNQRNPVLNSGLGMGTLGGW